MTFSWWQSNHRRYPSGSSSVEETRGPATSDRQQPSSRERASNSHQSHLQSAYQRVGIRLGVRTGHDRSQGGPLGREGQKAARREKEGQRESRVSSPVNSSAILGSNHHGKLNLRVQGATAGNDQINVSSHK